MIHKPWPFAKRLADKMGDSALQDVGASLQREPRSDGLHVSTLLRKLYPVKANDITEGQLSLMGLAGLAFEDRAELALIALSDEADWPWVAERPGELVSEEGIKCSPDVLLTSKQDGSVREASLKCTWKSCRALPTDGEDENGFPDKFNYYIGQTKAYCHVLGVTDAILVVYFVAGNYDKPLIPQFHAWELSFSHQEVAEEWDALTMIARGDL